MSAVACIAVVDQLGYLWCAECWSANGHEPPRADQMQYPVPVFADSSDPDDVCEGCSRQVLRAIWTPPDSQIYSARGESR